MATDLNLNEFSHLLCSSPAIRKLWSESFSLKLCFIPLGMSLSPEYLLVRAPALACFPGLFLFKSLDHWFHCGEIVPFIHHLGHRCCWPTGFSSLPDDPWHHTLCVSHEDTKQPLTSHRVCMTIMNRTKIQAWIAQIVLVFDYILEQGFILCTFIPFI